MVSGRRDWVHALRPLSPALAAFPTFNFQLSTSNLQPEICNLQRRHGRATRSTGAGRGTRREGLRSSSFIASWTARSSCGS